MTDVETPDLPDPQTLRSVAADLDQAADAIGTLHIDDVGPEHAAQLRDLQEKLRGHADTLEFTADDAEAADE